MKSIDPQSFPANTVIFVNTGRKQKTAELQVFSQIKFLSNSIGKEVVIISSGKGILRLQSATNFKR